MAGIESGTSLESLTPGDDDSQHKRYLKIPREGALGATAPVKRGSTSLRKLFGVASNHALLLLEK